MVNNAGTTHRNQPLLNVTEDQFDRVYAVNVKSLFQSAQQCVPYFRKKGGGVFITVASTAGVRPRPGLVWYNGSKGAAIVASRAMAVELAPDKIRVNVVNPVAGDTPLLAEFMGVRHAGDARQIHRHHSARALQQAAATSPMPAFTSPRTKRSSSPGPASRWMAAAASDLTSPRARGHVAIGADRIGRTRQPCG